MKLAKRCQLKSALVVNVADFYKEPQLDNSLTTVQSPEYQAQMGEGCLKKRQKKVTKIFLPQTELCILDAYILGILLRMELST